MSNISHQPIEGIYTALATPFLEDGSIDWDGFERLLQHQITGGVDGIVISGTTGESPTLSVPEKLALIRKAKALAAGKVLIMAGTGGNNTASSVELSKLAYDAGADSLLIVTPPYNKPSLAGLLLHFNAIADAVDLPICLYHVPSRTGQFLKHEEIVKLCQIEKIQAVKEASGNPSFFSKARAESDANYLSGDDFSFLVSLAVGGKGLISVMSNLFPAETKALYHAFNKNDHALALQYHDVLFPLIEALFVEANPGPLKVLLEEAKLCKAYLRGPLAPVLDHHKAAIIDIYHQTSERLRAIPS